MDIRDTQPGASCDAAARTSAICPSRRSPSFPGRGRGRGAARRWAQNSFSDNNCCCHRASVDGGGRGAAVSGAQLHREGNVDYDNGTRGAKWMCAWYVGARAQLLCGMDMPCGARAYVPDDLSGAWFVNGFAGVEFGTSRDHLRLRQCGFIDDWQCRGLGRENESVKGENRVLKSVSSLSLFLLTKYPACHFWEGRNSFR